MGKNIEEILDASIYELTGKGSKTRTVRTVLREVQKQIRAREQGLHTHQHLGNKELEALLEIVKEKKLDFAMLMEMDLSE